MFEQSLDTGVLHINSNPKEQEQNSKSWEDRSNKSHQKFFEYVSGEFRARNFIYKEPSCEKNAYSQQDNCQMWKYGWIYWRNIPHQGLNFNLEWTSIIVYKMNNTSDKKGGAEATHMFYIKQVKTF